jgi:hypothetical protein
MPMTKVYDIEIPAFFCPVDPVMHPDVELVERRSGEWATKVGLVRDATDLERWHACTAADFYGGMVPAAITDRFQIAADWVYWGFYFDDARCDEGGEGGGEGGGVGGGVGGIAVTPHRLVPMVARLLRILDSCDERLCGGDRYLAGIRDLARRYQELATPTQYERWMTAHRRWLFGVVQQNVMRGAGGPACLDDYLLARLHDCGGAPTQAMFEFANGPEIPGAELDSPAVRAVTEVFWLVAALDNDRVSRYKEVLGQHDLYNTVDILVRTLGLSESDAIEVFLRWRDRLMLLFLRLREQLMRTASEPLRIYLDTLRHGIRSNIDWSLRTPRYATLYPSEDFPDGATIRLHGGCTDRPSDSNPEPLPAPSIAWWWTQLS